MTYKAKDFRHQDTKTRRHEAFFIIIIFFLCLGAFVANLSGLSGLVFMRLSNITIGHQSYLINQLTNITPVRPTYLRWLRKPG